MIYSLPDRKPLIHSNAWVAPNAVVSGRVELRSGVNVWYGAVLRGDLKPIIVDEETNIQDLSVLHTDHGKPCTIGRQVTVGHRAIIHGAVVGDGCLIGMGAILLGGCVLEDECLIAAGSLLPQDKRYPARSLVMGMPARVVRALSDEEVQRIRQNASEYLHLTSLARLAEELE